MTLSVKVERRDGRSCWRTFDSTAAAIDEIVRLAADGAIPPADDEDENPLETLRHVLTARMVARVGAVVVDRNRHLLTITWTRTAEETP